MTQLVTRIPEQLAHDIDALVAGGVVESRSAAVRLALEQLVDQHRRQTIGQTIADSYRRRPQSAAEIGWADTATVAMIAEEPW